VTVCIAAVCERLKTIVMISDRLISADWISTEGVRKFDFLALVGPWVTMFAGDEAFRYEPLSIRIRDKTHGRGKLSLTAVADVCHEAYKIELQRKQEMEILLPTGWTREAFLKEGRASLGEYRFTELEQLVTKATLGVDLLVAGFDDAGYPQIFEMCNGAILIPPLPYHAIGAGRAAALSRMYTTPHLCYSNSFEEIAYGVCAAKFAAESTPTVGKDSTFVALEQDGDAILLEDNAVAKLRRIWETKGKPPVPRAALNFISKESVRVLWNDPKKNG
jgi:hypothetical protein